MLFLLYFQTNAALVAIRGFFQSFNRSDHSIMHLETEVATIVTYYATRKQIKKNIMLTWRVQHTSLKEHLLLYVKRKKLIFRNKEVQRKQIRESKLTHHQKQPHSGAELFFYIYSSNRCNRITNHAHHK